MEQHLSQYKIFYEVARTGNISKAAKELYISQPAISKAIGKLEESLNTTLFFRSSRGVQLTEEGEILYEYVRSAFDSLTRGEEELKRVHEFHIGHLRIGVSNTLCKYILLPYLKGFVEQCPHVQISIESQSSSQTLAMLDQSRIDLGLVAEPKSKKGLTFTPVLDIKDAFVTTPQYLKNLRLREGEDVNVFQKGTIMLLDGKNMSRTYIDQYLSAHDIEPKQILEVTTMDLIIEFAKIGLGIGCVIRDFVQDELDANELVEIPLASPIPKRTIGFACRSDGHSKALSMFLQFCRQQVSNQLTF